MRKTGLLAPSLGTSSTTAAAVVALFAGCGIRADSPRDVTGTITMKMISNTSNTSIIGVTLMSDCIDWFED